MSALAAINTRIMVNRICDRLAHAAAYAICEPFNKDLLREHLTSHLEHFRSIEVLKDFEVSSITRSVDCRIVRVERKYRLLYTYDDGSVHSKRPPRKARRSLRLIRSIARRTKSALIHTDISIQPIRSIERIKLTSTIERAS